MIETINLIMQWLVAPVAIVVWYLMMTVNRNNTDIAVLKAQVDSARLSHDREIKEMKETLKLIFNKLDSIEHSLRDRP